MSRLATLIRQGREAKGWTLRKAAAETEISNGYLSLLEVGRAKAPSPSILMSLATHYELSFPELMELAGHPSGPVPAYSGASAASGASVLEPITDARVAAARSGNWPRARGGDYRTTEDGDDQMLELAELLSGDVQGLTMQEIAQVRAFIAGLRAARQRPVADGRASTPS